MSLESFSRTAVATAMCRAAHQILDDNPKILADPIALRFVGQATEGALRNRDHSLYTLASPANRVHFCLRNRIAEDRLADSVGGGINQYVILGAGLDTFAYRQPEWAHSISIIEVDHPDTQKFKLELLRDNDLEPPHNASYLPVDFSHESLIDRLCASRLDQSGKIFVSWLGVSQYLTPEDVARTLAALARWPGGCELVMSYMLADWTPFEQEARVRFANLRDQSASVGEPWLSSYSEAAIMAALATAGFASQEVVSLAEVQARYFDGRTDGLRVEAGPSWLIGACTGDRAEARRAGSE